MKTSLKVITIIVGVIVVLGIGAGGMYYYMNRPKDQYGGKVNKLESQLVSNNVQQEFSNMAAEGSDPSKIAQTLHDIGTIEVRDVQGQDRKIIIVHSNMSPGNYPEQLFGDGQYKTIPEVDANSVELDAQSVAPVATIYFLDSSGQVLVTGSYGG
jgi:hypothetical protein